jgi:5-hydroxyisourate hydrolase
MGRIIVEVLDGFCGRPAAAVGMRVDRADGADWVPLDQTKTSDQGIVSEWDDERFERGVYRIAVESDEYFSGLGLSAGYPEVNVLFRVRDRSSHYRIQVALSLYSYSAHISIV